MNRSRPRLSVAVPLYRSAPFVANVAANIRALGDLDAEVLVSDRHLEDEAAVEIRRLFARDDRVTVLEETDGLDWASHYNHLLQRARGEYFAWMPHDDLYAAGALGRLARGLDDEPAAVLAFGTVRYVT
jgi:GT2 family glycosyltransferase